VMVLFWVVLFTVGTLLTLLRSALESKQFVAVLQMDKAVRVFTFSHRPELESFGRWVLMKCISQTMCARSRDCKGIMAPVVVVLAKHGLGEHQAKEVHKVVCFTTVQWYHGSRCR
jgi:hypothetical protein